MGAYIPKARNSSDSSVVFSYGAKNCYKHDVATAGPYYKRKGYVVQDHTSSCDGLKYDTIEINITSDSFNVTATDSPNTKTVTVPPGILLNQRAPPSRFTHVTNDPTHDLPATIRLKGSANITLDDLAEYAIKDELGQIVSYHIIAYKLIIDNAPLQIPCPTDFPVPVLIQCMHIEINSPQESVTIVQFNVANGPSWAGPADPLQGGATGKPAAVGGFLDLRVASNWLVKAKNQVVFSSADKDQKALTLYIKYTGGVGGLGQTGGRGHTGRNGANGTDDRGGGGPFGIVVPGERAKAGEPGERGQPGGNGGTPAWFRQSRLIASLESVPNHPSIKLSCDVSGGFGAGGAGGAGMCPFIHKADETYLILHRRFRRISGIWRI